MTTLVELVKKLDLLKAKLQGFEDLRIVVEEKYRDPELITELLLDIDELCIAPLMDEIKTIEQAELAVSLLTNGECNEKSSSRGPKESKKKDRPKSVVKRAKKSGSSSRGTGKSETSDTGK